MIEAIMDERALARACVDLGASSVGGPLSDQEMVLIRAAATVRPPNPQIITELRRAILRGEDPLGIRFCRIRGNRTRRKTGAFYTERSIVDPIVSWVVRQGVDRLIDAGCGSGRFTIAAYARGPGAEIIAVDIDPLATLMTRASLAVLEATKVRVLQGDYTTMQLPGFTGRTGFIGNPPYVRHHDLSAETKSRGARAAFTLGHRFSRLAGLHAHFFLSTATHAKSGDVGAFVTSAEWLDVKYGSIIRDLMLNGLGGCGIHVVAPNITPFEDAMTTAAIAYFKVGSAPKRLRLSFAHSSRVRRLDAGGGTVPREVLGSTSRWSPIAKRARQQSRFVRATPATATLGDLFKISRGVVTGANAFFVLSKDRAQRLGIADLCVSAITSADEILETDGDIVDCDQRRQLLDPSANIRRDAYPALHEYLKSGEISLGELAPICERYICSHRKPWWRVRASRPPLVMTYMARQAPKFARNVDRLAVLNVVHGLHPRLPLSEGELVDVVVALNRARESFRGCGRTYHGGLEKFEPSEAEDLPLPDELVSLLGPRLEL